MEELQKKLSVEIAEGRKEIKTDNLSMSIGEIINLYREGDIELAPAYQRLFRWDDEQKSRFIESIILGIPLPPIFVAQKENGQWSVVDGLQRLSTLLQLADELKIEHERETEIIPALKLTETSKLPSLEGFTWLTLHDDVKRMIKRSKLNINIILTENSIQAQYELFQRLNTGGLQLESQEIRNCLIIMVNEDFYKKINELKKYNNFESSLELVDFKRSIEFPMELILRYFISKHNSVDYSKYKMSTALLSDFIDKETINLLNDDKFIVDSEIAIFKRLFDLLNTSLGGNAFKKFNSDKGVFEGAFNISAFEAITTGVALNIDNLEKISSEDLVNKIKSLYTNPNFLELSKRGVKALPRIKGMIEFSKEYFRE